MRSISRTTHRFVDTFLEGLNCPRALTVSILLRYKEYDQIASLQWDPFHYNSLVAARDSLAATSLLSKFSDLPTTFSTKEVAMTKFYEAENQCRATNQRLRTSVKSEYFMRVLSVARGIIRKCLGDGPDVDELLDACNWGPGATTQIKRMASTSPNKFAQAGDATCNLLELYGSVLSAAYPTWRPEVRVVEASKVVTVPKNAKTDRTIAVEPCLNMWVQKGIGTVIRRRIKRHLGIDLNSQQNNSDFALKASRGNSLATIDFSAASDTVSIELVTQLLPRRWFYTLERARSRSVSVDGVTIPLQKFSAMGNGYTFELESLIFYAIACAVAKLEGFTSEGILIFGDDLTLPSALLDIGTQIFALCGFTVNRSKSYSTGYYRESCGSHYWDGTDIKPIFLKRNVDESKTTLLKSLNSVRRLSRRRNHFGCDRSLFRSWEFLSRLVGDVPRISDGYGDCGVIENIDHPATRVRKARHGYEGFVVRVWLDSPLMIFYEHDGLLLSKLRQMGPSGTAGRVDATPQSGNEVPRPGRTRMVRKNLLIPVWSDLGPWC